MEFKNTCLDLVLLFLVNQALKLMFTLFLEKAKLFHLVGAQMFKIWNLHYIQKQNFQILLKILLLRCSIFIIIDMVESHQPES